MDEKSIFNAARNISDANARQQFLALACGENTDVLNRIQDLLTVNADHPSFLENPAAGCATATCANTFAKVGDVIGPYKLQEKIGEGGMGSVWVARQTEPIKRTVAIKLIKAGMDSKSVLARFEAERQALAMMDHPNIARVLDGGITDEGRPFFAMEYVKGVPLMEYCDSARLSINDRLDLFIPICQAVQHAHQKGIIHRDLKPSNILVCLYDGKPVPKVIDFGLAKAVHQPLTESSVYTAHGIMVGTPLYMSPEQAEYNNLDIDTRSDIYSLGVILYELLTGSTPLEKNQIREAAANEILRLIKDVDPPRPSTRLSGSASLPSVAAQRNIEPSQLTRNITGDLDWVVMRALEKERSRRYETANGLAADIRRHLNDEPVSAGPPSTRYRMKKFIKRNRTGVMAVGFVAFALLLAVAGTTGGMLWAMSEQSRANLAAQRESKAKEEAQENAERAVAQKENAERELARANEIKQLIKDMLSSVDPVQAQDADTTLLKAILNKASERLALGEVKDELVAAELHGLVGVVYSSLGIDAKAEKHNKMALDIYQRKLGPEHQLTLNFMHNLANVYSAQKRFDEALALYQESLKIKNRVLGHEHIDTIKTTTCLAGTFVSLGQFDEAETLLNEAIETASKSLSPEHRQTLAVKYELCRMYVSKGNYEKAEPLIINTLASREEALGPMHPETIKSIWALAFLYSQQGRLEESAELYNTAAERQRAVYGEQHRTTLDLGTSRDSVMIRNARQLARSGQWERSAEKWVQIIKRMEDNNNWFSPRKLYCRVLARWPEVLQRVADRLPNESTLWIGRGQYNALRNRWELAAIDYERGSQGRPLSDESIVDYAGVLLLAGDEKGYQKICDEMVKKVSGTQNSWKAFVAARVCLLGKTDDLTTKLAVKWASMRLYEGGEPLFLHVMGLAEYRAGEFEKAIKHLEQSNAINWRGRENGAEDCLNWIILAMCHHRLGNTQKSQECYETATGLVKPATPEEGMPAHLAPCDWIAWHILHQEAIDLLGIKAD